MKTIKLNESDLKQIVAESVKRVLKEAFDTSLKKGDKFSIPQGFPKDKYAKMLAKKYGVNENDFRFDGVRLVYTPVKTKKDIISKPENMSIEDYYNKLVLPNNTKMAEKENQFPNEDWKPVQNIGRYFNGEVDYGAYYEVSNYGRLKVINLKNALRSDIYTGYDAPTRKAMQFHLNGYGEDGASMKTCPDVKYIVADAWLEPHDMKYFKVIHLDGDYHNNNVNNLAWVPKKN